MIRVLQVVKAMERGGLETYLMNVYRNIDRQKIQFDFLVHRQKPGAYEEEIKKLGGEIYRITSRRENYKKNVRELNDFFNTHTQYQIVHMHESSMSYIEPLKIAHKHGVPVTIMHSRNSYVTTGKLSIILHYFNRLFLMKYITDFFAISDTAAIWMFGKKNFQTNKVKLLKNGIEVEKFRFSEEKRQQLRDNMNIEKNEIVIGHVGRFSPQKNHIFLIDVFEKICKVDNNYKLLLIGDGEKKEQIRGIIEKSSIKDKIIIMDSTSLVNELYNVMDIFALPSLFEGLGRVLIEAQCNGLKTITTRGKVPNEVKMIPTFEFVDLQINSWVNAILKSEIKRVDNSSGIIAAKGYDMKQIAKQLELFYLDKCTI